MPTSKPSALQSPVAQNLASAGIAGVVTLIRPARFPRLLRRGLSLANTAGTAGSAYLNFKHKDGVPEGDSLGTAIEAGSAIGAVTGGLMLVTSGIGLKVDSKVESMLVKRGVKHPRLVMAVGVVGIIFAVKTVQDATGKKAAKLADKGKEQAGRVAPKAVNKLASVADSTAGGSGAQAKDHDTADSTAEKKTVDAPAEVADSTEKATD